MSGLCELYCCVTGTVAMASWFRKWMAGKPANEEKAIVSIGGAATMFGCIITAQCHNPSWDILKIVREYMCFGIITASVYVIWRYFINNNVGQIQDLVSVPKTITKSDRRLGISMFVGGLAAMMFLIHGNSH